MRTDFAPNQRPTVEEALRAFVTNRLVEPTYRPATQSSYRRTLQEFVRSCGDIVYADELNLACVRRFDQELVQRHLRAGSRHTKIAALKAFISYLEQQDALPTPIACAITLPAQGHTKAARPVDADDAGALLRAAREAGK